MAISRRQQVSRPARTWFTPFADSLELERLTLSGGGQGVQVVYGGVSYSIPAFSHQFEPDKQYDTSVKLWLAPGAEGNLIIDLTLQDGLHDEPPLPVEPVFSHSVLLAWGVVPADGETLALESIAHTEDKHGAS